jgi:NAD(P)H-hydrate epimerase
MRQQRQLFSREPDTNKYDYGHVLVIGGSLGMAGAPSLAAEAALRCGAGLVSVAVPECIAPTVAGFMRECMVLPLAHENGVLAASALSKIDEYVESRKVTACVFGCGAGRSDGIRFLLTKLLRYIAVPTLVDGDGLWALAQDLSVLNSTNERVVLTPHVGEFSRIMACGIDEVMANNESYAQRFAAERGVTMVLKGHRSVITDGERTTINLTGNPGMATAGSGDVLSGIIAAFLAQQVNSYDAAVLGADIHGMAGDEAARQMGQMSLIASDIIRALPQILRTHAARMT